MDNDIIHKYLLLINVISAAAPAMNSIFFLFNHHHGRCEWTNHSTTCTRQSWIRSVFLKWNENHFNWTFFHLGFFHNEYLRVWPLAEFRKIKKNILLSGVHPMFLFWLLLTLKSHHSFWYRAINTFRKIWRKDIGKPSRMEQKWHFEKKRKKFVKEIWNRRYILYWIFVPHQKKKKNHHDWNIEEERNSISIQIMFCLFHH